MAESEAFWAIGSTFEMGDGASPEVFTPVAEITKLKPPNQTRDDIKITHTLSPDGFHEYIGGWRDGGEVPIEANWLPTNTTQNPTTGLLSQFYDNQRHNYRIVIPDVGYISLRGYLNAHEPDLDLEKQGMLSANIKISGKPTFTET